MPRQEDGNAYFINPLILYIARRLNETLREILSRERIFPGQHTLLMYLKDHEGCTQSELARQMRVSLPSMSVSLRRLQERGFIRRTVDEADARRSLVTLTPDGNAVMEGIFQTMLEVEEKLLDGMTGEEIALLRGLLFKALHNLDGGEPDWERVHHWEFEQADFAGPPKP